MYELIESRRPWLAPLARIEGRPRVPRHWRGRRTAVGHRHIDGSTCEGRDRSRPWTVDHACEENDCLDHVECITRGENLRPRHARERGELRTGPRSFAAAAETSAGIRPGWCVYFDDLNTPWAIKLSKPVGEYPLLGFEPLRDPNLEVVPKLIKVRHINIQTAGWKQRSLPIGTEQHRLALLRVGVPNINLELPTLDSSIGTWRIGYVGPESRAFNPPVQKHAVVEHAHTAGPGVAPY